jgi:HEAT repeat protein
MIRFTCPNCHKHLKAPREYAGKHVKCTRCGHPMTAPSPETKPGPTWLEPPESVNLAAPDRAASNAHTQAVPSQKPKIKGVSPTTIGLGIGAALVVIGAITLAVVIFATPSQLDQALTDLKGSDPAKSNAALQLLAETDPQDAGRSKVTAALETLIVDGDMHKNLDPDVVLRTYLLWVNKDNVPAMTRMVRTPTMPHWNNQKAALVMTALAKLGDERAFPALAEKLADPALHDQAINALRVAGPKSQKAVLNFAFDNDPNTRMRANNILAEFNVPPKAVADEAFARLKSPQADVRGSAVGWFVENGPNDDRQKNEGAKLLGKLLVDQPADVCSKVLQALKSWATKDCLPDLAEYARREQKSVAGSPELIDVLAHFSDPTAAEAIALQLPNVNTRAKASQTLLKLTPPVADNAVLHYTNHPDLAVQKEARALSRLLKISDDRQLDQTLADVADSQISRSRTALHHLAQLRPNDASRAKVSTALNATLLEPTRGLTDESLNALRVWSSKENIDTLVKMLGPYDKAGMGRNARVIEFLGALKDPRAAAPLALGLDHGRERGLVSKALKMIGPEVQDAVIPYLGSPNEATRIEACRILGEVGTSKSLDPLRRAYNGAGGDNLFSNELVAATQKIMARN